MLSTVHARLDWTTYLRTLRANGTLCLLGMPPGVIQFPPALLVTGQRSITGSDIGGRRVIREMLAFSARHGGPAAGAADADGQGRLDALPRFAQERLVVGGARVT